MPAERKRLLELQARYELEPRLFDVYVEGRTDAAIARWYLAQIAAADAVVYEIGGVDVPAELVQALELEDGARGHLIALAHYLGQCFPNANLRVLCIADADTDVLLARPRIESPYLQYTDYSCIEMYLYSDLVLTKLFQLALRHFDTAAADLISQMTPPLQQLFGLRAANQALELNVGALSFARSCSVSRAVISLDFDAYVQRYLNSGARWHERERFRQKHLELMNSMRGDARMYVHGHDFIELLSLYVRRVLRPREYDASPGTLARMLTACLEVGHVEEEPLFAALAARSAM